MKIRAIGDNSSLVSDWVHWCYSRATFDGNFTWDENTTDVDDSELYYESGALNYDVIDGGHFIGLQMGAH